MTNIDFTRQWLAAVLEPPTEHVQLNCIRQGWGVPHTGQSVNGTPFHLHGRNFTHGLGVHADSEVAVTLDAPARRFHAWVGVDHNEHTQRLLLQEMTPNSLRFSIEAEGQTLWQSPPLNVTDPPVEVNIPLDNVRVLTLKAVSVDGNISATPADWADAFVEMDDGSQIAIGESLAVQRLPRNPLFSFVYNGRPSSELLPQWNREHTTEEAEAGVTLHRLIYRDPDTKMAAILGLKEFSEFPAVEWVVRFRNDGTTDSPLLEDIHSLDIAWTATADTWLHRGQGSRSRMDDFAYQKDKVDAGAEIAMVAVGGRSSESWLPFFNVQTGDRGFVTAIGWSGQWAAHLARDPQDVLSLRAGMERTHLSLHPGEEIRTPGASLIFWQGKPVDGNNLLRRFIVQHHTPRPNGEILQAPLSLGAWGGQKTDFHVERIRKVKEQGLPYDVYWIDAGWYGTAESYSPIEFTGTWAGQVGNWYPNPIGHPEGMAPIGKAAKDAGLRFLLWFEPERAIWGTEVTQKHPEWFLGEQTPGKNVLLDLGNPEAREWLTDYISQCISDWNIGMLRQDFNFEPLPYWRAKDTPDRQGMAEIRHIEGFYQFWDELLRRHPSLMIDNCASGGRRIDLETTSRSIPLWRSDFQCQPGCDPLAAQCHTAALSYWVPLSGTSAQAVNEDTYTFRCSLTASIGFGAAPSAWRDKMLADYRRARPFFYGDYYPLTRYSISRDVWCAYQLHRPDLGEGMILAFRREECPFTQGEFALSGLEMDAEYLLENADTGETQTLTAQQLLKGLSLTIDAPRQSQLLFYRRNA